MYFLSRPRRFGKSLLLSTMKELSLGNKALFDDLWIADKWDWTHKSPVVYIFFLTVSHERQGLEAGIRRYLLAFFDKNQIILVNTDNIKACFLN